MSRVLAMVLAAAMAGGRAQAAQPEPGSDVLSCLVKPKQVVQIGSPVFGMLAKVFVDRSTKVTENQIVAKLDTTVEETQLALDRFRASNTTAIDAAKTDLAWNQREMARREKIAGNMFSKANEIDEIATKVDQDRISIRKAESDQRTAELEAARSEGQYKLKLIRSPVNGVVSDVKLSPGEFIYEQTPIMTIVQYDPLTVDLTMSATLYRAARVGTVAQVYLATPVNAMVSATVDAVDPIIDAASDTFRVRLLLPNPNNAIPAGVRCNVRLPNANG